MRLYLFSEVDLFFGVSAIDFLWLDVHTFPPVVHQILSVPSFDEVQMLSFTFRGI